VLRSVLLDGTFGNQVIDLLPLDDITAIADEHLQTDGAFAAVVLYLQGPEWTELVETVGAKPAVQDFIQYLTDAGLPVDDILAWIDNLITGATPGTDPDEEGSLRPLLDEIEAILPLADLLALLNDKLQNSPDFQALYVEVSSEKLTLWSKKSVHSMKSKLLPNA
jgi:hypothetical protein